MKKISKFIKNNYKFLIGVIVGLLLPGTGVYAANTIYSKNVTYDNSNSGLSSVNVQDALDELYLKMYPSQFYKKLYESAVRDDESSTYVSSSSGIDFASVSSDTNGKGLYIASEYSDYKYPILYYRGNVDNNNLIFANFCWKIVRTTETGGIKLIYNGTPSNGTCNNTGTSSQIGTSAFNTNYNSVAYIGYMYGTVYTSNSKYMYNDNNSYYYGYDVTYSNGKYTLVNAVSMSNWSNIYDNGFTNYHYTCMGGTTCTSVYYIYYTNAYHMYYITLNNGKDIEDAKDDMLVNNNTSSTIKNKIDNWYYVNIVQKGYSEYIEDTVWCNDRSIGEVNGWNYDRSTTRKYLFFNPFGRSYHIGVYNPSLNCSNEADKFTVDDSNGNGVLTYPVGLLTADELIFAGSRMYVDNTSYYLCNGQNWWTISPAMYSDAWPHMFLINDAGKVSDVAVTAIDSAGVRPAISLAPGVEVSGGNGTKNNPYVLS